MVVHAFHPTTRRQSLVDVYEIEDILVYVLSSGPAVGTTRRHSLTERKERKEERKEKEKLEFKTMSVDV